MTRANSTTAVFPNGRSRWVGVTLTALIAVIAMSVQWGVFVASNKSVAKEVAALTAEIRSMRDDKDAMDRRLSRIEGRLDIRPQGDGP